MGRRTRHEFKRLAEARLPHRVDVPVPELGLGRRLTDMHAWCRERLADDAWAQQHHSEPRARGDRGARIDFARFYFLDRAAAEAFRRRWLEA